MDAKEFILKQKEIMNKKYIFTLIGLSFGLFLWFLHLSDHSEMGSLESPDWYKHYAEIKMIDPTQIPHDLKLSWYKKDQENFRLSKKSVGNLENILEAGPTNVGGRTRSILIHQDNENVLFAGGVSGGLWNSNNQGITWNNINDHTATLSVTSITQSPFNSDLIYYGSGETYNNLLNVNGLGMFRSTDGGQTIEHLESSNTTSLNEIWDVEHSLVFDSTIYIGTDNGGLWMSSDAGETYKRIYSASRAVHEVRAFTDSTVMFTIDGSGIFIYNETDGSTRKLSNGLPGSNFSRISFDYCKAYPKVIFAQFLTGNYQSSVGMYKSSDGGESWAAVSNPSSVVNFSQGWYDFKIGVSPTDSNFILSMAVNAGFSQNGGQNWTSLANSHADYHEVQFFKDGNSFLIGNDGGVYKYQRNNLSTFTDLNRGYNVTQFYAGYYHPTEDHLVAGAQDNNTRYSLNGAPSWTAILGGDGGFCAIHQQSPEIMYVSYQYLMLFRRTSSGTVNISNIIRSQIGGQNGTWFINPFEINNLDGNQIYVPTRNEVFRSTNAGNSWVKLSLNQPGQFFAVGLSNDVNPMAYLGGTGSKIFRIDSANINAQTEVDITLAAPTLFRASNIGNIEVDPTDKGTIYVAMTNIANRPRIWKITGADTDEPEYHNIHSNLPEGLAVNWIEVDPENTNFIIIGTDYGLYTSTNGGGWWEKETRIPNVAIDQIRLRESDRKLYIFTHGRGAWTATLAANPTSSIEKHEPSLSLYPNPATHVVKVNYTEDVTLQVYSLRGSEVASGINEVNVAELPAGYYFVKWSAGEKTGIKKIMVTKS